MAVIFWYALFALTTAIVSIYELVHPVLTEIEITNPEDNLVQNKFLSYMVFLVLGILCAPLLIVSCIVPSAGNSFRSILRESLVG